LTPRDCAKSQSVGASPVHGRHSMSRVKDETRDHNFSPRSTEVSHCHCLGRNKKEDTLEGPSATEVEG
jgi:hypothetical protein